jgi:hypothetical protein
VEEPNLLQDSRKKEEEDVHCSEHTIAAGMNLFTLYDILDGCAK